jgi:hypothetical protein
METLKTKFLQWRNRYALPLWAETRAASRRAWVGTKTVAKLIWTSPDGLDRQFRTTEAYDEANKFKLNIEPKPGADYEWVWEYAKFQFERADAIYKDLDNRAHDIIKYLGGGTGLLTFGALANVDHRNVWVVVSAIPAFLCAIVSIALAARARQPNPTWEPPPIDSAFRFAGEYKEGEAKPHFLGQWHLTCELMYLAVQAKSKRIAYATMFYVLAIVLLAIPIVVAIRLAFLSHNIPAL